MKGRGVDYNVLTGAGMLLPECLTQRLHALAPPPPAGESAPLVPLPAAPQPVAPLARAGSASSLTAGGRMTLGR